LSTRWKIKHVDLLRQSDAEIFVVLWQQQRLGKVERVGNDRDIRSRLRSWPLAVDIVSGQFLWRSWLFAIVSKTEDSLAVR
jgi:hypothetical protein